MTMTTMTAKWKTIASEGHGIEPREVLGSGLVAWVAELAVLERGGV
jgi:hypothetical protein